jgi:hypothetical protein
MAPIDEAIADFKSCEPGDDDALENIAKEHGVDRSTLGRRFKGVTGPRQDGYASQQKLNPQQEEGLVYSRAFRLSATSFGSHDTKFRVEYIETTHRRGLGYALHPLKQRPSPL